jgi:hypothetical protein
MAMKGAVQQKLRQILTDIDRGVVTFRSPACDVVSGGNQPSPKQGGPCATCAFRNGTEASQTPHTMTLARLCVEGLSPFMCHEKPGLCHGFIAAANLRGAPCTETDIEYAAVCRETAEHLADAISAGAKADALLSARKETGDE